MAKYAKCTISSGSLNVRNDDSMSGDVVFTLKPNEVVEVLSTTENGWYRIKHPDGTGYCSADSNYMSAVQNSTGTTGTINLTSGYVNVRTGPGTSFDSYYTLSDGASVKVHEVFNGWKIISTNSGIGCVLSEYVSSGSSSSGGMGANLNDYATAIVNADYVNVRNTVNGDTVRYKARENDGVQVLDRATSGGYYWYKIYNYTQDNDIEGWIRGDYLTASNIRGIGGTGPNRHTFLRNIRNGQRSWQYDDYTYTHPEIKRLQQLMNDFDIRTTTTELIEGGYYGSAMKEAVEFLQYLLFNGASSQVDGIFGKNTLAAFETQYLGGKNLEDY